MNLKEINELRRLFRPDRSAISKIYGCYVNGSRLPEEEVEMYLGRLKKTLSGVLGKNMIDIVFSTQQVMDSEEHKLLSALRNSQLSDAQAREAFYQKVIGALDMGQDGYLILLAAGNYDVPRRGGDGETDADGSDQVFRYIVCAICPVKDSGMALRYFLDANEFHSASVGQVVANTSVGFLFPAFDNRAANLYNALYYAQKPAELHQELIDALFRTDMPLMSAAEQREAFHDVLKESLEGECGYDLLQTLHEQLRERIEEHREVRDPEPLGLTPREIRDILESGGVSGERLEAFERSCGDHFGGGALLTPGNLIDSKRFEIVTPEVRISVDPAYSYVVEERIIDGRKYLLIPAEHDVTINGVPINAAANAVQEVSAQTSEVLAVSAADSVPWREEGEEQADQAEEAADQAEANPNQA